MNIHEATLLQPIKHQSKQCYCAPRAGSGGGNILQREKLELPPSSLPAAGGMLSKVCLILASSAHTLSQLMGSAKCRGASALKIYISDIIPGQAPFNTQLVRQLLVLGVFFFIGSLHHAKVTLTMFSHNDMQCELPWSLC